MDLFVNDENDESECSLPSLSSASGSDEEDMIVLLHMIPKQKIYRKRNNALEMYDDIDFQRRFRFSKTSIKEMLNLFDINAVEPINNRNYAISALDQLLITLRYYATGSFQQTIGDHMNIHKSTVCRIVPRITRKIAECSKQFICMPTTQEEILHTMRTFYSMYKFPRVIGAVDCTHVKITSPGGDNAEIYRNRKGWFSINTQAVCDANLIITDIVARWPGSVHDSTIFNSSALRAKFEAGEYPNSWLLGDNGYACKPYLLTPLLNPATEAEEKFNRAHIRTRNTIERCFGVLKRRFPCLSRGMSLKPEKVVEIIVATAVLHNIAIMLKDDAIHTDYTEDVNDEDVVGPHIAQEGQNTLARTTLINTVFT